MHGRSDVAYGVGIEAALRLHDEGQRLHGRLLCHVAPAGRDGQVVLAPGQPQQHRLHPVLPQRSRGQRQIKSGELT